MKNTIIVGVAGVAGQFLGVVIARWIGMADGLGIGIGMTVSYTHLRAHETLRYLV